MTAQEYKNKLFYKKATLRVLQKGHEHNIKLFSTGYINESIRLSAFLLFNKQVEEANNILEPALLFTKDKTKYWMREYVSILTSKGAIYEKQATRLNNKIYIAIEKQEEALMKIKEESYKDNYGEEEYCHSLLGGLINLGNYYSIASDFYKNNDMYRAINYTKEALILIENMITNRYKITMIGYIYILQY